jgi:hypothetical protein
MAGGFAILAVLGLIIVGVMLILAPLKLFSIDNKLAAILAELRANRQGQAK